jgi:hypothetical protein
MRLHRFIAPAIGLAALVTTVLPTSADQHAGAGRDGGVHARKHLPYRCQECGVEVQHGESDWEDDE